jgi:hypothetical protein
MSTEKPHLDPNVIMNIARLQRDHQFRMPYQLEGAAQELFPDFTEQQIEEAVNHCLSMIKRFAVVQ